MGRKAPRKIYTLDFSDTPYGHADEDGDPLEVKMSGLNMRETLDTLDLEGLFKSAGEDQHAAGQIVESLVDMLGKHLLEWNLEDPDNGDPVSATKASLMAQDPTFLFDLIAAYRTAVLSAGKRQSPPSNGGAPVLEASLPMEPLSQNPPSLSEPSSSSTSSNDSPDIPSAPSTKKT